VNRVWLRLLLLSAAVARADQPVPAELLFTEQEAQAYQRLESAAERGRFLEAIWARRDPTPGSARNELREQFEQRIEFVNTYYREPDLPGWRTHRGQTYLILGPPLADLPRYVPNPDTGGMHPARSWTYDREQLGFNSALLFVDLFRDGHFFLLPPLLRQGDLKSTLLRWRNRAAAETLPPAVRRAYERTNRRSVRPESAPASAQPASASSEAVTPPPLDYGIASSATPAVTLLSITFRIPLRELVFVERDGRWVSAVALYAQVLDPQGASLDQTMARERFSLSQQELDDKTAEVYLRVLTLMSVPAARTLVLRAAWEPPCPAAERSTTVPLPPPE
jgi:GWxTD domain-containing protein